MIKINKLEIENVKRVKAVKLEPSANGLTVIGGRNGQGKTSVLDSIAWALGGDRYKPSAAQREGSVLPPNIHIVLSNGLVVDRKGKNSDLKVTDPNGQKSGQQLLNEFVEELAINLPKFMHASDKEKADTLLQIIGVGDRLLELERQEQDLYNQRRAIGQIADQKEKFAKEMIYYPDAPKEPISASDMIRQQQDIITRNAQRRQWIEDSNKISDEIMHTQDAIEKMEKSLREMKAHLADLYDKDHVAQKTPAELEMESTAELEESIRGLETINRKVRCNLDKDKAEEDALGYRQSYDAFTTQLNDVRKAKTDLLTGADLPLAGLSVDNGELLYNGFRWDSMSSAEQLRVATAIVRRLKPECGFVLLDKLEQMDLDTMKEFGAWLESEGLQAIATRVSTGEECSIIIEDGYSVDEQSSETEAKAEASTTWKAGEF